MTSLKQRVSRDVIKRQVIEVLDRVARPIFIVAERHALLGDLGMSKALRGSLALTYSRISRQYKGKAVGMAEAADLKTVKDTIDLVFKRANS